MCRSLAPTSKLLSLSCCICLSCTYQLARWLPLPTQAPTRMQAHGSRSLLPSRLCLWHLEMVPGTQMAL